MPSVPASPRHGSLRSLPARHPDALALGFIFLLTALAMTHRWIFDDWLSRHDLLAFFLPWYGHLGDRLAAGDIPGWASYTLGGVPFAGDPESGWMYFPAMLLFPFFNAIVAYKLLIVVQLLIAGTSTYIFARVMGLGVLASVMSTLVYEFGPLLFVQTDCCTIAGQLSPWIPLGMLGVELSLRSRRMGNQVASLFVSGLAISQILAAWVGQGSEYGIMMIGAWAVYRTLINPPGSMRAPIDRVLVAGLTGGTILLSGFAISAAGLLPRLAFNAQSNNPGGTYDNVPDAQAESPYLLWWLLRNLLTDTFINRAVSIGGVAAILAMLALLAGRRQYAVPFWAGLSAVVFILSMHPTLLHRIFYLIPTFEAMHTHAPRRLMWIAPIAPAMLAGIGIQILPGLRQRLRHPRLVFLPLGVVVLADVYIGANAAEWIGWTPYITATVSTLGAAWLVYQPEFRPRRFVPPRFDHAYVFAVIMILLVMVVPHAQDAARSLNDPDGLTQPNNLWQHRAGVQSGIDINLSRTDTGGAGEFLQRQQSLLQPFRYVGYSGRGYVDEPNANYSSDRLEPSVMAILVNGRPFRLGLQGIQGYNPVMLAVWADWMTALNRREQNYHYTDLLPEGFHSPLLDALNVRYIVVDATIPADRPDIVYIAQGRMEVFRNAQVVVYENPSALPRAWIVHQVQPNNDGDGLALLAGGAVNPRTVAFIDGPLPALQLPANAGSSPRDAGEEVVVADYSDDEITFQSNATATGLMVVSEVYEEGWRAYLDGEQVDILRTDHALRGVVVPAGAHEIVMKYEPESLRTGIWISGIAIVGMAISFAWSGATWLGDHKKRGQSTTGSAIAVAERADPPGARRPWRRRWLMRWRR